ncbi:MAG TPA: MBL fold metallo-hydrolase [Jiangellaceae bacterium]
MLLLAFAAPVLGTNCYVVALDDGQECLIVDPGIGVDEQVDAIVEEHALRPVAALVTHGHLDHTFSLAQLCQRHDLPVYIHEADAYRLGDPLGTLSPDLAHAFAGFADDWTMPPDVRPVHAGDRLDIAGLDVSVVGVPGHTEGSVFYYLHAPDDSTADVCFTGDVLFAGTVGRTDLPGGDPTAMATSLAGIAHPESEGGLPDTTAVLPGHGEPSTFGAERVSNPYLHDPDIG